PHRGPAQLVAGDLELLLVGVPGVLGDPVPQHVDHDQRAPAPLRLLMSGVQRLKAHLGGDESDDDSHLLSWNAFRAAAARSARGLARSYWSIVRMRGTAADRPLRPGAGRGLRPGAVPTGAGSRP